VTFGEVEERVFLALEGTGGYVYLIPETPEIEQRRREGGLRRNDRHARTALGGARAQRSGRPIDVHATAGSDRA
jgi:hypothetical protein